MNLGVTQSFCTNDKEGHLHGSLAGGLLLPGDLVACSNFTTVMHELGIQTSCTYVVVLQTGMHGGQAALWDTNSMQKARLT